MSLINKAASKTAANAEHVQLELADLREFSFVRYQDGNKCILVAHSIYGLWVWRDATRTTKAHCNPGEYVVVREDGSVIFRDATQLAAMNLVPWVAPDIQKAIFY